MGGDAIGNVFVLPQGFASSLHESNAGDTVDDGLVVAVIRARFEIIEEFRVATTGGLAREVLLVTDLYGSRLVMIGNGTIFDEDTRHAVACSRHDIMVVKTDVLKATW